MAEHTEETKAVVGEPVTRENELTKWVEMVDQCHQEMEVLQSLNRDLLDALEGVVSFMEEFDDSFLVPEDREHRRKVFAAIARAKDNT